MKNLEFANLLIARKIIFKIIDLAQEKSQEFLSKDNITIADFDKIFEEIEIPLCVIADDMAIVIHQELLNPVTDCQNEIESVCKQIQESLKNSQNFERLIVILKELVNYFHNIINSKNAYPETSKIFDGIESICNHY